MRTEFREHSDASCRSATSVDDVDPLIGLVARRVLGRVAARGNGDGAAVPASTQRRKRNPDKHSRRGPPEKRVPNRLEYAILKWGRQSFRLYEPVAVV